MILNNNFTSITYLGSFNPNILTERFLTENNILGFLAEPLKTKTTSIASNIEYKDLSLISDLKSFTVIEKKIDDFTKARNVTIANNYIDLLRYTPVKSSALNLNSNLKLPDIEDILIMFNLKDDILDFFEAQSYTVNTSRRYIGEEEAIMNVGLGIKLKGSKTINIGLKRLKNDIFNYNFNYFVSAIDKNPDDLDYIFSNFKKIVDKFCSTNHKFFKK